MEICAYFNPYLHALSVIAPTFSLAIMYPSHLLQVNSGTFRWRLHLMLDHTMTALWIYRTRYTQSVSPTPGLPKGPSLLTTASKTGWTTDRACTLATRTVDPLQKSQEVAVLLREGIGITKWMGCFIPTSGSPSIMISVSYIALKTAD